MRHLSGGGGNGAATEAAVDVGLAASVECPVCGARVALDEFELHRSTGSCAIRWGD